MCEPSDCWYFEIDVSAMDMSPGTVSVSFARPVKALRLSVTRLTARSSVSGAAKATVLGTSSPITVGLTDGRTHTFAVTTTNSVRNRPASTASSPIVIR